jgi:hypothetical protein
MCGKMEDNLVYSLKLRDIFPDIQNYSHFSQLRITVALNKSLIV